MVFRRNSKVAEIASGVLLTLAIAIGAAACTGNSQSPLRVEAGVGASTSTSSTSIASTTDVTSTTILSTTTSTASTNPSTTRAAPSTSTTLAPAVTVTTYPPGGPVELNETDNGQTISVTRGQVLHISLPPPLGGIAATGWSPPGVSNLGALNVTSFNAQKVGAFSANLTAIGDGRSQVVVSYNCSGGACNGWGVFIIVSG